MYWLLAMSAGKCLRSECWAIKNAEPLLSRIFKSFWGWGEHKRFMMSCRVQKWEQSLWDGKVRKGFLHQRCLDGSLEFGQVSFSERVVPGIGLFQQRDLGWIMKGALEWMNRSRVWMKLKSCVGDQWEERLEIGAGAILRVLKELVDIQQWLETEGLWRD